MLSPIISLPNVAVAVLYHTCMLASPHILIMLL